MSIKDHKLIINDHKLYEGIRRRGKPHITKVSINGKLRWKVWTIVGLPWDKVQSTVHLVNILNAKESL